MNSTEVENSQCKMQVALLAGVEHVSWFDFSVAHKTFDFPQAMWHGGAIRVYTFAVTLSPVGVCGVCVHVFLYHCVDFSFDLLLCVWLCNEYLCGHPTQIVHWLKLILYRLQATPIPN